ncbi:MAG: glucose 1-dehydrogenase [Burkholderiaceae bacterium]
MTRRILAISGGGQGIGRAVAWHFAANGYAVSIADIDADAAEATADKIVHDGGLALAHRADVSVVADVERWVEVTQAVLGCPDVVVNDAGISRNAPFLSLAETEFDRVIAVNLRGCFLVTQRFARRMVAADRGGAVINIASTRALMSEPNTEAYSASKGGIVALTHASAVSLGAHGIRVNCVSPGWIETRAWKHGDRASIPAQSERDRAQHPVGRVGVPDDVAQACLYLAGSAGFVTGQNLVVDGGMTVRMIYEP